MSDKQRKLFLLVIAWTMFIIGYFWPRGHYNVEEHVDGLHICYVQWDGSKACSAPLEGWIPVRP